MPRTLPCAAVVDVTSAATAPSDVLSAFDVLDAGEMLLLRTVTRPRAALDTLRENRAGCFEWVPLMEGPGHWEVEVHKRDATAGTAREVTEALGWDHDRLDAIEVAAMEAWEAGDARKAADLHARFAFGLRRHIRFEETSLFPEFETIAGLPPEQGPTAVMRMEHRIIERLLADMTAAAGRGRQPDAATRDALRSTLYEHNVKEENVVYPALDRELPPWEHDAFVFLFQSMDPAE